MKLKFVKLSFSELNKSNEVRSFIKQHGSIFQQIEFLEAVGDNTSTSVATDNDEVVGVLTLVSTKKSGFRASFIPSYCHIYGPILKRGLINTHEVLVGLIGLHKGYPLIELKAFLGDQDIVAFKSLGATIKATQTHIYEHNGSLDENSLHSSKRRYLKKLLIELSKGHIKVNESESCKEQLLWLQEQTSKKSGFKVNISKLKNILQTLTNENSYSIVVTTQEGKPLSGAFCPFDSTYAYHLINASVSHEDNLLNRSNILTTYLAIKKAMELGLSFDFEGSNVPGVARYYRNMGGAPKLLYRIQIPRSFLGRLAFGLQQMM